MIANKVYGRIIIIIVIIVIIIIIINMKNIWALKKKIAKMWCVNSLEEGNVGKVHESLGRV